MNAAAAKPVEVEIRTRLGVATGKVLWGSTGPSLYDALCDALQRAGVGPDEVVAATVEAELGEVRITVKRRRRS